MNKYLFVINPVAGGNDQTDLIAELTRRYGDKRQYDFYETTGKRDIVEIEKVIESFQPDTCIISGGDGTINMLIPTLIKYDLAMGIIPSGSANGLAADLDIVMDNALDVITHHKKKHLDIVKLNEHYMLHLADFGLNASLVKRYENEKRRGFLGYAISALKEFPARERPFEATISFDGKEKKFTTEFLVIANARSYGTGFMVNPKGITDDGKVEICVLKEFSSRLIFSQLLTEDPTEKHREYFECFSVDKATINVSVPTNFQSDGEYHGELEEVKVEVLPRKLVVLVEP